MADFIFTGALGRTRYLATLPATNDALIAVILKASGLEADSTLRDYTDLATLLAAANDECDFTGYTRRTLSGVSNTAIDTTNNRADTDASDLASYTNSGGASQAAGKLLICYDGDTTGGTDSNIEPIAAFDLVLTFDVGVATTVAWNASGIWRSTAS